LGESCEKIVSSSFVSSKGDRKSFVRFVVFVVNFVLSGHIQKGWIKPQSAQRAQRTHKEQFEA
jgi:hypothetical protein